MDTQSRTHVEPHIKESSHIRDLVFGFGDGVNTSLGIISGVGGASVAADIVILAALVGMFTGAKAMAVQNYLAVKSQREILESEIKREKFEIENVPDKERQEIEDIYMVKGFRGDDLRRVVNKITSDKDVWLKTMLTEELGLNLEILGSPLKGALVRVLEMSAPRRNRFSTLHGFIWYLDPLNTNVYMRRMPIVYSDIKW